MKIGEDAAVGLKKLSQSGALMSVGHSVVSTIMVGSTRHHGDGVSF